MMTGFRFRTGFLGRIILRVEIDDVIVRDATIDDMPQVLRAFQNQEFVVKVSDEERRHVFADRTPGKIKGFD